MFGAGRKFRRPQLIFKMFFEGPHRTQIYTHNRTQHGHHFRPRLSPFEVANHAAKVSAQRLLLKQEASDDAIVRNAVPRSAITLPPMRTLLAALITLLARLWSW